MKPKDETESPDLEDLARRYMDLWQKQLEGLASDRELAEITARSIEIMTAGAGAFANLAAAGKAAGDDGSRPAAAAAASGDPGHGLDDLHRRLAELERRVLALEAGTGGGSRKPARKSGRK